MDYMCIDMKSFYASVECVLRGLDPFTTPLVVADKSRGGGSLILAATPYLKAKGIPSRCRMFDIPKELQEEIIYATPRMRLYIEYSVKVYQAFLHFFASEDIHVYSIDESFIYIRPYVNYYSMSPEAIGKMVLDYIKKETGLTATCGIGENMFLCKVALDIYAKKIHSNIATLSKEIFYDKLWYHEPLTDFWSIGDGMTKRLNAMGLFTMADIALSKEDALIKEFGIIGHELYEHSWGQDDTKMTQIKEPSKKKSISQSQVLFEDYTAQEAEVILIEMVDVLILELVSQNKKAGAIGLFVGYSKEMPGGFSVQTKLFTTTSSYHTLLREFMKLYYENIECDHIRSIGLTATDLSDAGFGQMSIFEEENEKEQELYKSILSLKDKFGKNSVMRAISTYEKANQIKRNKMIGGHNSE